MTTTSRPGLDDHVRAAVTHLRDRELDAPDVFLLMSTGVGLFTERLSGVLEIPLAEVPEVPELWREGVLVTGRLGELVVWAMDDATGDPLDEEPPSWVGGFPVWMAAGSGAVILVHTSAGSALPGPDGGATSAPVGGFGFLRDHLNLSGGTPLLGLGESRLGPLFPDLSQLHHLGLRHAALERAQTQGFPAAEVICACTAGPSLETQAERTMLSRLGAEVSVQNLATPLLAAGHAGLACLAIVAVTDEGDAASDVARLVDSAGPFQAALEDLLVSLTGDLTEAVRVLDEELD